MHDWPSTFTPLVDGGPISPSGRWLDWTFIEHLFTSPLWVLAVATLFFSLNCPQLTLSTDQFLYHFLVVLCSIAFIGKMSVLTTLTTDAVT